MAGAAVVKFAAWSSSISFLNFFHWHFFPFCLILFSFFFILFWFVSSLFSLWFHYRIMHYLLWFHLQEKEKEKEKKRKITHVNQIHAQSQSSRHLPNHLIFVSWLRSQQHAQNRQLFLLIRCCLQFTIVLFFLAHVPQLYDQLFHVQNSFVAQKKIHQQLSSSTQHLSFLCIDQRCVFCQRHLFRLFHSFWKD